MANQSARDRLRSIKVLSGPFEPFDTAQAEETPQRQFLSWLNAAIAAGVKEPHAMTLSTVDADGHADARVLILKDLDASGWHFAVSGVSPKGRQIAHNTHVALTFYWPLLGRQVRIRGQAKRLDAETSAADFMACPLGSRAGALLGRQSDILDHPTALDAALAEQKARLEATPNLVPDFWAAYAVLPSTVEFWQGEEQRRHTRLRYTRAAPGWARELLRP